MKITVSPRYDGHYNIRIECEDKEEEYTHEKIVNRVNLKEWLSWLDIWCYSAPIAMKNYELPGELKEFLYSEYFDHLVKRICPGMEIIKY